MRRSMYCAITLAAVAALTACSTDDSTSSSSTPQTPTSASATSASPSRPTLTASSLQPPDQDNRYTRSSGRPPVAFDPCTQVSDDAAREAGFDPSTRKRGDDQVAETTFLICNFTEPNETLTLISGNATWEEDQQKNGGWSEPLTINGREALWVRDPELKRGCDIHLRTAVGFVDVGTTLTADGIAAGQDPCHGLESVAAAIEPSIGKDN